MLFNIILSFTTQTQSSFYNNIAIVFSLYQNGWGFIDLLIVIVNRF